MPQIWFMVEALIALARYRRDGKKPFTRADLRAWSEKIKARPKAAQHALDHLEACSLLRRGKPEGVVLRSPGLVSYMLTPEGRAAAIAAQDTQYRAENAVRGLQEPGSFDSRVFALLRMRRALTGPEAASTLVDAGGDVKGTAKRASALLRSWSEVYPDAIKVGEQRFQGAVRYVLVKEIQPAAPALTTTKKNAARGGAIA